MPLIPESMMNTLVLDAAGHYYGRCFRMRIDYFWPPRAVVLLHFADSKKLVPLSGIASSRRIGAPGQAAT